MLFSLLVADDNVDSCAVTEQIVRSEFGIDLRIEVASTKSAALSRIKKAQAFDVVVLDINFEERGGKKAGVEIAIAAREKSSTTGLVIYTGFADTLAWFEMLTLADIGIGTTSWVTKGDHDEVRLLLKAIASHLSDGSRATAPPSRAELLTSWKRSQRQAKSNLRGSSFEDFAAEFFSAVPGFRVVKRNSRIPGQELDLVVENNIPQAFWTALRSPLILVECKNWNVRTGADAVDKLWTRLHQHQNLTNVGFILSAQGFTKDVAASTRLHGPHPFVVAPISGSDLEDVLMSRQPLEEWLREILVKVIG